ncbi:class F sortase [Kitasatospora acidiphila]|uniref:class F sortase n=1 Tax=Kitasatospora acidiphila TaxID=2567942 RepID=UPI0015F1096A|nr:class F sortase [Kitasatospora acidiphila]
MPARRADHRRSRRPWRVPAAAGGVLALVCAAVVLSQGSSQPPVRIATTAAAPPAPAPVVPAAAPSTTVRSAPVRVQIPRLGVDAPVVPAGLNADGTAQVPPLDHPGQVDWYDGGPAPGETGPAVLLGHYDNQAGPAVFHQLPNLRPGDRIEIRRADGSTVNYQVRELRQAPKDAFPTDAVYGDTTNPQLRLITCGGVLQQSGHYSDNIIVFADLTAS